MKTNTDKNSDEHPRSAGTLGPITLPVNPLSSPSSVLTVSHDPSNFSTTVKRRPKFAETVKEKLKLGAKKGGSGNKLKEIIGQIEGEKLLKASRCFLFTTAGPIAGKLFISTQKVAFYSKESIPWPSPHGDPIRKPYKVLIPTNKIEKANESENEKNPSEKYMHIVTKDDFEFWFTQFKHYEKAFLNLRKALDFVAK